MILSIYEFDSLCYFAGQTNRFIGFLDLYVEEVGFAWFLSIIRVLLIAKPCSILHLSKLISLFRIGQCWWFSTSLI